MPTLPGRWKFVGGSFADQRGFLLVLRHVTTCVGCLEEASFVALCVGSDACFRQFVLIECWEVTQKS